MSYGDIRAVWIIIVTSFLPVVNILFKEKQALSAPVLFFCESPSVQPPAFAPGSGRMRKNSRMAAVFYFRACLQKTLNRLFPVFHPIIVPMGVGFFKKRLNAEPNLFIAPDRGNVEAENPEVQR